MCQCVTMHWELVTILFCLMCWGICLVSVISDAWTPMDWPIVAERVVKDWRIGPWLVDWWWIGGLVKDWRVDQRLVVNWHQIGNIDILLCKCSSRIGIGLTLNWQIGLGLPMDWWIDQGLARNNRICQWLSAWWIGLELAGVWWIDGGFVKSWH